MGRSHGERRPHATLARPRAGLRMTQKRGDLLESDHGVRGLVLGKAREKAGNMIVEKFPVRRRDTGTRGMSPQ